MKSWAELTIGAKVAVVFLSLYIYLYGCVIIGKLIKR
jgi:hypothetical protein